MIENTDLEIVFCHTVDGKLESFMYKNAEEALYDIALKLRDGYEICFLSMVTRVCFDYEKGEMY